MTTPTPCQSITTFLTTGEHPEIDIPRSEHFIAAVGLLTCHGYGRTEALVQLLNPKHVVGRVFQDMYALDRERAEAVFDEAFMDAWEQATRSEMRSNWRES